MLIKFWCFKFNKYSVACGKNTDCWQAHFLKMAMLKVKEDMAADFKFIVFHLVGVICT